MKTRGPGIFWKNWPILAEGGIELGLDDFGRVLEREKTILEYALRFVIDDMNSPFYDDLTMHARCATRIRKFGIERIDKLREFLEDPYPCAFTADMEDAERTFYEKAVYASELFRK